MRNSAGCFLDRRCFALAIFPPSLLRLDAGVTIYSEVRSRRNHRLSAGRAAGVKNTAAAKRAKVELRDAKRCYGKAKPGGAKARLSDALLRHRTAGFRIVKQSAGMAELSEAQTRKSRVMRRRGKVK